MKFIKGPPFLAADATIELNDLIKHSKLFTRRRYLNPNGCALIQHLNREAEYEDDDPAPGEEKKNPTFTKTLQPTEQPQIPTPLGAQEHIQNELNWVERFLDLTKDMTNTMAKLADLKEENQQRRLMTTMDAIKQALTPPENNNFNETPKERQARHVMEIQFKPRTPSPLLQVTMFDHEMHKRIDPVPAIQTLITPPLPPIDKA
jgi:hypothetical protein